MLNSTICMSVAFNKSLASGLAKTTKELSG
jgi:hypothetical protein